MAKGKKKGRLRIIGGDWRRRVVPVAEVAGLRPTSERVRETLFNWLAPLIDGARCADLCAGTGALGFEALSRGAREVTFIESSPKAVQALQQARALLDASGAKILCADARRYLDKPASNRFDIVFLDPPYRAALLPDLCRLLAVRGWLAPDARVYLEHDRGDPGPELPPGWEPLKDKTAGNVRYRLLAIAAEVAAEQ